MFFAKLIYYFIYFFIFVGEVTRKVIRLLFFILKEILLGLFFIIRKTISLFFTSLIRLKKKIKRILKRLFSFLPRKAKYYITGSLITLFLIFFYQSYLFFKTLPSPTNIGKVNFSLSSHIYDRKGRILFEIYREQNRTPVTLKELPKYLIQATIAIEDKEFYNHRGISLFGGIIRAIKEMILKKQLQGGSTITQQLVKSSLLSPERTISRKIKEIILALWTERIYTKDQILELYLNQVPYGGATYGIEEAAKRYFGKSAKSLNLVEAATLAGLPQAPSIYSPFFNPQQTIKRRNEVIEAMYQQNYIDKKTKEIAQKRPLNIIGIKQTINAPHFVFFIRDKLENIYGIKIVEEGGLRVITTLDLDIQQEVEKILKEEIENIGYLNVTNGAALVIRPSTGEILAMVGSVDYFATPSGAFNVITSLRQPGSAIKPIMYALALQKGYTAATILDDSPVVYRFGSNEIYSPVNYDGRFHGKIPLRYALANSYNIPAVKVLSTLGVPAFVDWGRKMGINSWKDASNYGLSLTLGGGEVKPIELAQAYSILANLGYRVPINGILQVNSYAGEINYQPQINKERILNEGIAYILSDILSDNFARQWAFGSHSFLEINGYKVAVKTGTTDNKKDNWTVGYTPEFLVLVWVGNNDGSPMNPYLTSGVTGAAPIWNRIVTHLLKNYSQGAWYEKPENIVEKNCYFGRNEYFIKGTEDSVNCFVDLKPTPTQ
jgi:1A family penicillin-binding protein